LPAAFDDREVSLAIVPLKMRAGSRSPCATESRFDSWQFDVIFLSDIDDFKSGWT